MKREYRMSFARLWMSWERPMPTATVDTKWRQIPWNGLHRGRFINMFPKIDTSFGTLMVWDGALANKNTSHPEAIGIEVWTKKLNFFFQTIFILINSRWSGYIRTLARSLERWSPRGMCWTGGTSTTKWRSKKKKTQTKTITDLKLILDYSVPFSTFSDYSLDTLHLSLM